VRRLFALVFLTACGPHTMGHADAGHDGGAPCTGAVFDPCTDNTQCTSAMCHPYISSGFTVCTQTCTPMVDSTCPVDITGTNARCNAMGLCKPAAPNNCTR
jgi:hypothetical protein